MTGSFKDRGCAPLCVSNMRPNENKISDGYPAAAGKL